MIEITGYLDKRERKGEINDKFIMHYAPILLSFPPRCYAGDSIFRWTLTDCSNDDGRSLCYFYFLRCPRSWLFEFAIFKRYYSLSILIHLIHFRHNFRLRKGRCWFQHCLGQRAFKGYVTTSRSRLGATQAPGKIFAWSSSICHQVQVPDWRLRHQCLLR